MSGWCLLYARIWTCIGHSIAFSTSLFKFMSRYYFPFFSLLESNACYYFCYLWPDDYGKCTTTFALQSLSTTGEKWKVQNGLELFYSISRIYIFWSFTSSSWSSFIEIFSLLLFPLSNFFGCWWLLLLDRVRSVFGTTINHTEWIWCEEKTTTIKKHTVEHLK